jgi:hypothetical protein
MMVLVLKKGVWDSEIDGMAVTLTPAELEAAANMRGQTDGNGDPINTIVSYPSSMSEKEFLRLKAETEEEEMAK